MIKWKIKYTEISYRKIIPSNEIKLYEGSLIDKYMSVKPSQKIALHVEGKELNSNEFTKIFNVVKPIEFIIGGAFGLSEKILNKCNSQISLSQLTFPHAFAKLILLEQIYRSQTILEGHPYHK